jgi:TonB family protein
MIIRSKAARRLTAIGLVAFLSILLPAQTPTTPFPVGRWVAEHPSTGGIASWWEFRPDGTLTLTFGVMVDSHIDRSGTTFMSPSGMVGGAPVRNTYTVRNNVLTIDQGTGHPATYARIGVQPSPTDPLIGAWRPLPDPNNPPTDPNAAILQQVMTTKGLFVFTPDSTEHLRIPFGTREGSWDAQSKTFRTQGDPATYTFTQQGAKLMLAQPPNGSQLDSYVPDPLSPSASTPPLPGQGTPSANGVVQRGPGVVMPQLINHLQPTFTAEARQRKISGSARLRIVVDTDGSVRTARIIKSVADAYTDPLDQEAARTLDQKAIEVARQYTFTPGTSQGKPVPITLTIEISFQIF